jgi:hypothetical protein
MCRASAPLKPSHQQRHHVWVRDSQPPEFMRDGAQLSCPVCIRGIHPQLPEHDLDDTVQQRRLARYVPIEHRWIAAHLVAEAAHRQGVDAVTVDDAERRVQDHRPAERTTGWAGGRGRRVDSVGPRIGRRPLFRHRGQHFLPRLSGSTQRMLT